MPEHIRNILSEEYDEPVEGHVRETFLVSVLTHIGLAMILVAFPGIFFSPPKPVVIVEPQQVTQLTYQPPPKQQQLRAPPMPKPPAAPAEQSAPQNPDALREPPQQQRIAPPDRTPEAPVQPRVPPPAPREPREPRETEPQRDLRADSRGAGGGDRLQRGQSTPGTPEFPDERRDSTRGPGLERPQLPRESAPAAMTLPPIGAPGRGTDAMLREMAKQRASGQGPGAGLGLPGAGQGSGDPNFNLPGPQILSDTMGVDFDPYLLRVYLAVRRNWYAVIPEIARIGRRGRVVLQFHILRNGGVQQLALEDGSGTVSLDSAALSSIRLSDPFPPLPAEFPGADIRLRFVYFYNMSPP